MLLEERYTRVSRDKIELRMIITDPVMYTRPWISETQTFTLGPKRKLSVGTKR